MVIAEQRNEIRIVILLGAPFTAQNFERTGIPYLSKYFKVIVFDCTQWLGRNTENIKYQKAYWDNFYTIKSQTDLDKQIEKHKPHYAIDNIGFGYYTLSICQILIKYKVKFIVQRTGLLPSTKILIRIKNRLIALIFKANFGHILDNSESSTFVSRKVTEIKWSVKLIDRCKLEVQLIRGLIKFNSLPGYIGLIAGSKSLDRFTIKCDPIVWIGSQDYHTFNKAKNELTLKYGQEINQPFILFIDDNLPNANDWAILGIHPPVTEALYYPAINAFFEKVESIYNMPVKIAGHPNNIADENFPARFAGRKVVFGETATLVLQSTLVLAHASTAISFAVMARKPIVYLTSMEIEHSHCKQYLITMSNSLGAPLVFIDKEFNKGIFLKSLVVDDLKYRLYEKNYLCNELSDERKPWEALIKYIKNNQKYTNL